MEFKTERKKIWGSKTHLVGLWMLMTALTMFEHSTHNVDTAQNNNNNKNNNKRHWRHYAALHLQPHSCRHYSAAHHESMTCTELRQRCARDYIRAHSSVYRRNGATLTESPNASAHTPRRDNNKPPTTYIYTSTKPSLVLQGTIFG